MHRLLSLAASLLVLGTTVATPIAQADDDDHDWDDRRSRNDSRRDFSSTLVATSVTPGQVFADAQGNRYFQGVTYSGQVSGWPLSGTFRMDVDLSFSPGSSYGDMDGSFALTDAGGSTIHGNIENATVQDNGVSMALDARVRFDGGTGGLSGADGRARLTGTLASLNRSGVAVDQSFNPYGRPGYPYGPGFSQSPYAGFPSSVGGTTLSLSGTLSVSDSRLWSTQGFWQDVNTFYGPNDVRPGNGYGDSNHLHTGAPGHSGSHDRDRDDDRHNNRGRGHGRD